MQTVPKSEIAAAQAAGFIYASERGSKQRELARRQRIYAAGRAQLEAMLFIFEEGAPELVLRGSATEVVLRLGDAVHDVEPILRDALDKMLGQMEVGIVALHLAIEREEQENLADPSLEDDYTSAVLHLCGFTEGLSTPPAPVSTPVHVPTREQVANVRPARTATAAPGTGFGSTGATATAAAA